MLPPAFLPAVDCSPSGISSEPFDVLRFLNHRPSLFPNLSLFRSGGLRA